MYLGDGNFPPAECIVPLIAKNQEFLLGMMRTQLGVYLPEATKAPDKPALLLLCSE
jgi:hypothetical protein